MFLAAAQRRLKLADVPPAIAVAIALLSLPEICLSEAAAPVPEDSEGIHVAESLPAPCPTAADCDLASFEAMALENNPTLAVAWARVNAARGRQVQSGLYPNPMIGYNGQEIGEDGTAGMQGGYVSQQIVTGKKLQLNRAMGAREVREQRFLFDAQELRVLNDVRLRFYDALVAQRRVALTEELARISSQLADTSRQLLEAQQVAESDLLQAEIEAEEAAILANNARNEADEAWRRLAAVVGVPSLQPCPLSGNLEDDLSTYDWATAHATVLAQHPDLAAAQARVERARISITRARKENVPDLSLMTMVSHMNQSGDEVVGVQAGIPLPIWNQNQGRIMETSSELMAAQNDVRRIELDLQEQLAMAYRQYANARQQANRYREQIVPRAERSLDLVGAGYREGQVDFLTLLTGQRTYIRVNLAYIDALAELRQATIVIEGQLLTDSLQQE
jgi:outer membrane protein, heavy metal efflux system